MKVSLNTIKQYADVNVSVDELVSRINQQLGGVEDVIDLGVRYKDALIVKVISAVQHPNADRLRVCLVDDGGVREGVERNDAGLVQVVCGAPNAREGIFAVWLPPQATVPSSFDDKEVFVLSSRELRGVVSHGMLAAADELAIGSDHEGIIEITETDLPPQLADRTVTAGMSFATTFGLDDTIIDIENKMFTHRPDLFGQLGVAREVSAILGGVTDASEGFVDTRYVNPDWYWMQPTFDPGDNSLPLVVANDVPAKSARIMSVVLKDITVAPSPLWLQCELVRFGSKPINTIVDATNYIMLLTAQPAHAYDYDKLRGHTLTVRMAKKTEKVTLLNHKTYDLHEDDIVIADSEGPIGLAGIMGGGDSEVDTNTKNIVLEVATFDMYTVRKTSMRHGVFTDALTRFNKGQSPLQNGPVLARLMTLINDIAGGVQASQTFDLPDMTGQRDPGTLSGEIAISAQFINARLGTDLTLDQIGNLLRRCNFASYPAEADPATLLVAAPFWRTDIQLPEDLVEEVGRLYGFDKLPRQLPMRSTSPTPTNKQRDLAQTIREALARAGANEVLTYSFVHKNILENVGQNPDQAFKLGNALSPDLQYYRLSITPSLLDKVRTNIKAGHDEFAIFEIGKGHSKSAISEVDGLPVELARIGLTYAAKTAQPGAPYYKVKAMVEYLAGSLGMTVSFKSLPAETSLTFAAPFEPRRSARVVDSASGQSIGVVGEYKKSVVKNFKLPEYSAGFELLPEAIELATLRAATRYRPLSRYPSTQRDICFQVAEAVPYAAIVETVQDVLAEDELTTAVEPVDIYRNPAAGIKNVTLRITLTSADRTLVADEAAAVIDRVIAAVIARTHATVI